MNTGRWAGLKGEGHQVSHQLAKAAGRASDLVLLLQGPDLVSVCVWVLSVGPRQRDWLKHWESQVQSRAVHTLNSTQAHLCPQIQSINVSLIIYC